MTPIVTDFSIFTSRFLSFSKCFERLMNMPIKVEIHSQAYNCERLMLTGV